MVDDPSFLWQSALSLATGLIGVFFRREVQRRDKEMADMRNELQLSLTRIDNNAVALAEHKTYAANTYAKESSLANIIKELKDDFNANLKEMREDIKTILRQTK